MIPVTSPYGPVYWHAHELLFGYVPAIIAGFILTAIPSWTGRKPVSGIMLGLLFLLWVIGRVAVWTSGLIDPILSAVADSLFLTAVTATALHETIAGQNRQNIKIAALIGALGAANIAFHAEVIGQGHPNYSLRAGIVLTVLLISIIGGRIIPAFTRNWLSQRNDHHSIQTGRFDLVCIALSIAALFSWVFSPDWRMTGAALLVCGGLHAVRLARWAGIYTGDELLVAILHIGYFFIPLGFIAVGCSVFWPEFVSVSTAPHAWLTGAVGVMTLAVMTRATRGHTGRPLTASFPTKVIYFAVIAAAACRLSVIFVPAHSEMMLNFASLAWVAAFGLFAAAYAPMLLFSPPSD